MKIHFNSKKRVKPLANEAAIWQRLKCDDRQARDTIICQYIYLVKYILNRLITNPHLDQNVLDYDDLFSAGTLGLIDAVEKFDLSRGVKFITFALPRIRGAIIDELREVDWLPRSTRQMISRFDSRSEEIEAVLGIKKNDPRMGEKLGLTPSEIFCIQTHQVNAQEMPSLQESKRLLPDSSVELWETIPDPLAVSPHDRLINREAERLVWQAVTELPKKQRQVIEMYWRDSLTLKAIGKRLGFTESRAVQLKGAALQRLRKSLGEIFPEWLVPDSSLKTAHRKKREHPGLISARLSCTLSQPTGLSQRPRPYQPPGIVPANNHVPALKSDPADRSSEYDQLTTAFVSVCDSLLDNIATIATIKALKIDVEFN